MKFGEKLRQLRLKQNLTQEQVSQAAGISRRTYNGYEQGGNYPRKRETYDRLASILNCHITYLMASDEEFVVDAAQKYGSRGKRQAEELVAELSGMFAGGELSEQDKDAVMIALQKAYFDCKQDNQKYTPMKYRNNKSGQSDT